jgi:hypothetical protein
LINYNWLTVKSAWGHVHKLSLEEFGGLTYVSCWKWSYNQCLVLLLSESGPTSFRYKSWNRKLLREKWDTCTTMNNIQAFVLIYMYNITRNRKNQNTLHQCELCSLILIVWCSTVPSFWLARAITLQFTLQFTPIHGSRFAERRERNFEKDFCLSEAVSIPSLLLQFIKVESFTIGMVGSSEQNSFRLNHGQHR